jgi:hypothetical protein
MLEICLLCNDTRGARYPANLRGGADDSPCMLVASDLENYGIGDLSASAGPLGSETHERETMIVYRYRAAANRGRAETSERAAGSAA